VSRLGNLQERSVPNVHVKGNACGLLGCTHG